MAENKEMKETETERVRQTNGQTEKKKKKNKEEKKKKKKRGGGGGGGGISHRHTHTHSLSLFNLYLILTRGLPDTQFMTVEEWSTSYVGHYSIYPVLFKYITWAFHLLGVAFQT